MRDIYFESLVKLKMLKVNQWGRVRDFAPKNQEIFVQIVKGLIRAGWSEYEFNDDYTAIKRLDMPEFARDYLKEKYKTIKIVKPNVVK